MTANNEVEIIVKNFVLTEEEYDDFSILDDVKIDKIITMSPTIIGRLEIKIASLEQQRFKLHQEYKREKARKILAARKLKGEDKLTNATDRESWALLQESVIAAMDAEIECVTQIKEAKAVYEYWRNQFIAARKLANKVEKQLELELQNARFVP